MKDFSKLSKQLGVKFKDSNLLTQAFCHRSYINENRGFRLDHNERLEFLGDAVLELVVTEFLFTEYPDKAEGELTSWRAALVNTKMLAAVSEKLSFYDFLLLSTGEARQNNDKARQYILANTFEAFVGALYLDGGLKKVQKFIGKNLLPELPEIIEKQLFRDAKSRFQEEAQEHAGVTPTYKVLKEWGPDHERRFQVGVFLEEEQAAVGEGSSKQEAEEQAATAGLEAKGWL